MGMKLKLKVNNYVPSKATMSGLRWGLAAALAGLALIATAQSLRTYQAHEMTTGMLAVLALAVLLLVGLGSLGMARLRIGRELTSLHGGTSDGELLSTRRRRLEAIRASGVRPDRDILAETTRADEAGRAYIGRYLVATTVLIGLVGTFAGLMQTLGKMAPLFGERGASDIALLVTPLAGLHVTFGASLVAILSTLALALAQGDLALCEEQALALLEDRTRHDLIPRLWPESGDAAADRMTHMMKELQETFVSSLTRSIDASLKTISESARTQTERSARALETVAATLEKELTRLGATIEGSVEQGVVRQSRVLEEASRDNTAAIAELARSSATAIAGATAQSAIALDESLRRTTDSVADALARAAAATEKSAQQSSEGVTRALQPLLAEEASRLDFVRAALGELGSRVEITAGRLVELTSTIEELTRDHIVAIERSGQGVLAAFDRAVLGGGASLEAAAGTMATAARELQTGTTTLVPCIGNLATELGALGREVALLLASRGPDGDVGAVVLGELDRLGAGMERLTELARLAARPERPQEDDPAPILAEEQDAEKPASTADVELVELAELASEGDPDLAVSLDPPAHEDDTAP